MSALVGKAGEALVAAELMRRGMSVAFPACDTGVDLLAYREPEFRRAVPIQVKARQTSGFNFDRSWFRIKGLVLIHVWHISEKPEFYIFRGLKDVVKALGKHAKTNVFRRTGRFAANKVGKPNLDLMRPHQDRWERISDQL